MARLTYIHDTLCWDEKPVNELNYTERGQMAEYVNNMPEEYDLEQLDEYESLQKDINDELESYRKSRNELLKLTKEELLAGFIDTLEGFLS